MAAMEKTATSRANSLSIEGNHEAATSQTHLLHGQQNGTADERNSLSTLARRSTIRKRSLR